MSRFWMVRSGGDGSLAEEFLEKNCVAIGFDGIGDLSFLTTLDAIKARIRATSPERTINQVATTAGILHKFRTTMSSGDQVVTYVPDTRYYHLARLVGDYEYMPGFFTRNMNHIRRVSWSGQVSRDELTLESRNSLGSAMTVFELAEKVILDLVRVRPQPQSADISVFPDDVDSREEVEQIYADQLSRSHEFIKDRLSRLKSHEMELLAAALLRALGFRTRVTPGGPDRGRDVVASMDGLGLHPPRVLCEVKHRKDQIGAPDVRSFIAGLRSDDRGLYLSTGGFTKEAKYEAERATIPMTLLDLDELAKLVVEHYESFDTVGKALIPLERFYWPKP